MFTKTAASANGTIAAMNQGIKGAAFK
ncbi:uncharacterized protein METZ01_LOCUS97535 [marine metagenome]|uniref:Uncharacterized protein n=1 Tax=marine metagenome TaxID=408172 RepID=A0A381VX55_9ZZZZ